MFKVSTSFVLAEYHKLQIHKWAKEGNIQF